MNSIFLILFLLSVIFLIIGIIKPSLFKLSRKTIVLVGSVSTIVFFTLIGITSPPVSVDNKEIVENQDKSQMVEVNPESSDESLNEPILKPEPKPYILIHKEDTSIPGRKRAQIFITSNEAGTFEELALTAIKAASEYQKKARVDFVEVFLEASKSLAQQGLPLAIAKYAPDGKGYFSDATKLSVEAAAERPEADRIKARELYEDNKHRFKKSNGMYDEEKIKNYIAGVLKVKPDALNMLLSVPLETYEVKE